MDWKMERSKLVRLSRRSDARLAVFFREVSCSILIRLSFRTSIGWVVELDRVDIERDDSFSIKRICFSTAYPCLRCSLYRRARSRYYSRSRCFERRPGPESHSA